MTVTTTHVNVLCFGSSTGSAIATPAGGTAPYTYLWNTVPAQTTAIAINLAAGNYTVTVTDIIGCIATANATITQPATPLAVTTSQVNVLCFGNSTGSATAIPVGGTAPYTYSWNTVPVQTTATASNLSGGNYIVTVIDNDGCVSTANVSILEPLDALTVSITKTDVQCFGGSSSATAIVQGGTAPYSYSWNTLPVQTTATANNLSAGNYMVTVTDSNGCLGTANVIINQSAEALVINTMKTDVLCFGEATGSATANPTGGTAPYMYLWNTIPVKTTATVTGLTAGTYNVSVTDANGCTATAPATIVALNSLPTAEFTSSQSGLNIYTFVNTSVNATSYAWDFGDGQTSTIADPIHVYATAGTYTVKLTVANSCGTDIETQVLTVPELEFFNGFSPNGDGQNDNWNIPVLNYYPVNSVLIINRWGSEIWKGINYNNKDIVWTGKNMNGEDMPDGTYYYIINYDNTGKRGWVFIKR